MPLPSGVARIGGRPAGDDSLDAVVELMDRAARVVAALGAGRAYVTGNKAAAGHPRRELAELARRNGGHWDRPASAAERP